MTLTGVPAPPPAPIDWLVGLIAYEQTVAAAWLTVNVRPAMVRVPSRAPPVFAATLKETPPFPLPLAPDVMVSHPALLVAVQLHPAALVTLTDVPAPPPAPIDWLVGLIAYEQTVAAAWLTVNVRPAMVRVPSRAPPAFAATLKIDPAFPAAARPAVMVSHPALLVALQLHPDGLVTLDRRARAAPGADRLAGRVDRVRADGRRGLAHGERAAGNGQGAVPRAVGVCRHVEVDPAVPAAARP